MLPPSQVDARSPRPLPRTAGRPAGTASLAMVLLAGTLGCAAPPERSNVLLVTFDTTRADAIGAYGNDRARTPVVDALAAEGVLFRWTYSPVPITLPAHTSLLTGLYPPTHGVRDNGLFTVPDDVTTLAEVLGAHGWATGAAVGAFPLASRFNLDQGFDFYDDSLVVEQPFSRDPQRPRLYFDERSAGQVNEAVFPWLAERGEEPFFLWLHYYDPHQPLQPPAPYDQLFADDAYAGEIAYADESLGAVLDRLRRLGLYENTLVVFTSDHGEGLGEHREQTHSYLVYDATVRVPMVFRLPAGPRGIEVGARVRSVDVFPTVLDILGIEVPDGIAGRSLRPLWTTGGDADDRPHYVETLAPRLNNGWSELRGLYEGKWKYVHGSRPELFDLERDPGELENLVRSEEPMATALRGRLQAFLDTHKSSHPVEASADAETRARLEALGYLTGAAEAAESITEELRDDGIPPQERIGDVTLVTTAKQHLLQRRPQAARELAAALVDRDPGNRFYLELLANCDLALGRLGEALAVTERALELGGATGGSPASLLMKIGASYWAAGDSARALELVERSTEVHPSADASYLLSTLLAEQGRLAASREALDETLALDPEHGAASVDWAIRAAGAGETESARQAFERTVRKHPYFGRARFNYGVFLLAQGEAVAAAGEFERTVRLEPGRVPAYVAGVEAHLAAGDRPRAEELAAELQAVASQGAAARRVAALLAGQEAAPETPPAGAGEGP